MTNLNNTKIHFFHKLGEYLNNLSDKASKQAEEIDGRAVPEFNAVAIPGLPVGTHAETYKNIISILPKSNIYLTTHGKYPSKKANYLDTSLFEIPLVIGNFTIPDLTPSLKERKNFGLSTNMTLKSNTYALQEISHGIDGAYLNSVKKNSLFNLEHIVFDPLFGEPMMNPLVVFSKNDGIFLYKSMDKLEEELNHPDLISSQHINNYTHSFIRNTLKDIKENVFAYNTAKALDLNTGIISNHKTKK